MSIAAEPVYYPESDGQPMAETDVHRDEMFYFIESLRERYRGQNVYVSGSLLLYYVEGDPKKSVSPDCLVAFGRPAGDRRVYKTWTEGKVPDVVFEVTSESTRTEDEGHKRRLYARLGVRELWLVDPLGDYLGVPFRGYRLAEGDWEEVRTEAGRAHSDLLGLDLCTTEDGVRLFDPVRGEYLLSPEQTAVRLKDTARELNLTTRERDQAARERDQATQERDQAAQARDEANQRLRAEAEANAALRAEIERLRAALGERPRVRERHSTVGEPPG